MARPPAQYAKTILMRRPEFAGRLLFVADPTGPGILRKAGEPVTLRISRETGEIAFQNTSATSLRQLGQEVFGLRDPSVPQMLKRLITPEMEIERVFNSYRYKFVKSLAATGRPNTDWVDYLDPQSGNDVFTVLIGGTLRGDRGGKRARRLLKSVGFDPDHLPTPFATEREELTQAVTTFWNDDSGIRRDDKYRELIAIKPGLHERWVAPQDHLESATHGYQEAVRSKARGALRRRFQVLLELHGERLPMRLNLETATREMPFYFRYSPCHATTGPCFLRRHAGVALRTLLPKVGTGEQRFALLLNRCVIYDYADALRNHASVSTVLREMMRLSDHRPRWLD